VPAPAATPAPGDPTYHEILQGKDGKGAATPPSSSPAPASTPPAVAPPVIPPPAPPAAEKSAPKAADTKAADSKSAKAAEAKGAKAAEPKAGDWFVQTGVFRTKEAADKQVQQLKARAYAAFVSPESSPEPRFRVRIGPFVQKGDAERMAARLAKEGQTPFVTR
jgi:cell division protein FtsN